MRFLPHSRRRTWLLAAAVWCAACAGLWWGLPVVPRAVIEQIGGASGFAGEHGFTVSGRWFYCIESSSATLRYFDVQSGTETRAWPRTTEFKAIHPRWEFGVNESQAPNSPDTLIDLATGRSEAISWWPADNKPEIRRSANGRYLVFTIGKGDSAKMIWWRRDEGRTTRVFDGIAPLGVAADGRWIAAGESPTALIVHPAESLDILLRIERETKFDGVSFSADGGFIILDGMRVRVVDASNGELRAEFRAPRGAVVFADVQRAATVEAHDTAEISRWNLSDGQPLPRLSIGSAHWSHEPSFEIPAHGLCLGRSELRPSQWDLLVHRWLRRIGLNVADLNEYRDAFTVYDMRDGHECAQIRPGKMAFEPLISPDGRTLAIPTERRDRVELWDIPPRKSLTWRAAGAALLALPIALVAWRRVRKLRAA